MRFGGWVLLILISIVGASSAFAGDDPGLPSYGDRISDPHGLLPKILSFLRPIPFEQAIRCGDTVYKLRQECKGDDCHVTTSQTVKVVACGPNQATIVSKYHHSAREFETVVMRSDYDEVLGSNFRRYLKTISTWRSGMGRGCRVIINDAKPVRFPIGQGKSTEAMRVNLTATCDDPMTGDLTSEDTWVLGKEVPWISQDLLKSMAYDDHTNYTWKVKWVRSNQR